MSALQNDGLVQTLPTPGSTDWFVKDRFGLFIHWGLYALGARHEWLRDFEAVDDVTYDRYLKYFDPDLYDPEMWAKAADNAGMKYFVITTKHHEGFALWDSKATDYKVTNTPYGRDLLTPMADAFRAREMKVGFYHSLIDWHHEDFIVDPHIGPYKNEPSAERDKMNEGRDQGKYADFLRAQVCELLTEFGKVDIMWLDFSYPKEDGSGKCKDDWKSEELYKVIRELQPEIVLNDRLDLDYGWDIKTPEQYQPESWLQFQGKPVVWEACQTFSGSWGYHRDQSDWKSVDMLVGMLIDTVSKGGNLLLNVGPTGRGEFDARALDRLNGIGEWMKRHSRSIYGCTQAPSEFQAPQDCRLTWNSETNRLYIHVLAWPFKHLHLHGQAFVEQVEYAQLLNDASEVQLAGIEEWQMGKDDAKDDPKVSLTLPIIKPDVTVPVIEVFLK